MTDPRRTPDPVAIAETLPAGAAVVYRPFGDPEAAAVAARLARVARRRRLLLLIGGDEDLARRVGADGLHLPERMGARLPALRRRRPLWILSVAAHSERALRRAERLGADAALLSSAYPSGSASDHTVWGPVRFARLARAVKTPVLALGGVNGRSAARLAGAGAAGLAAVEAWLV